MARVTRVSTAGVARVERKLSRAQREADQAIREELRNLAPQVLAVYQDNAAGGRMGRIGAGLAIDHSGSSLGRPQFQIVSTYRTAEGYDPLGVTRFGHRRKFITPSADRAEATVLNTSGLRGPSPDKPGGKPTQTALAFYSARAGKVIFRHWVAGVRRESDWVKDAAKIADPLIKESAERLGRKVVSSLR